MHQWITCIFGVFQSMHHMMMPYLNLWVYILGECVLRTSPLQSFLTNAVGTSFHRLRHHHSVCLCRLRLHALLESCVGRLSCMWTLYCTPVYFFYCNSCLVCLFLVHLFRSCHSHCNKKRRHRFFGNNCAS